MWRPPVALLVDALGRVASARCAAGRRAGSCGVRPLRCWSTRWATCHTPTERRALRRRTRSGPSCSALMRWRDWRVGFYRRRARGPDPRQQEDPSLRLSDDLFSYRSADARSGSPGRLLANAWASVLVPNRLVVYQSRSGCSPSAAIAVLGFRIVLRALVSPGSVSVPAFTCTFGVVVIRVSRNDGQEAELHADVCGSAGSLG